MNFVTTISPLTNVRILSGVPLDNSYTDTLTFGSATAQYNYFAAKAKYNKPNMTPVSMQPNTIAVDVVADNLYDCNYIMFQNKNFNNKWFYAFIVGIEFVNVNMSRITFELDVWQTWYFDITIKQCFVEREHVNDDSIGANLVPDNVERGEYVYQLPMTSSIAANKCIVCATTVNADGSTVEGGMLHGVYQGCSYLFYDATDGGAADLNDYLKKLTNATKSDAVVSLFMAWRAMAYDAPIEDNAPRRPSTIDGYTPVNNKLYTDPYVKMIAWDGAGSYAEYSYEFFKDPSNPKFELTWDITPNPSIYAQPKDYSGYGGDTNKLCVTGFPQCSYVIDTYKAWLAQNGGVIGTTINTTSNLANGLALGFGSALTGGALGGIGVATGLGNAFTNTFNSVKEIKVHAALPPTYQGTNSTSVMMANDGLAPHYQAITIRSQFAKRIDDFWSKYGYPINDNKVPNITGRPSWNFVKTQGAVVVGSVPFDDIVKIKSTLNNGITFWHGDFVGDYGRSNK